MSASSEVNLKQTLRKTEFPLCAKEALNKIGELICSRITSIKNMDLALDLMTEFVFCEVDRRGNKRANSLTPMLELQLLEILYDHFNKMTNEAYRNTVFLSLFSGTTVTQRLNVLSKLVSFAISMPSAPILNCASTWMQQLGNTSVNSCKLADALIYDYFLLVPYAADRLDCLPELSPQFTANFLTAISENYFNISDLKKEQKFPPKNLLETITAWLSHNGSLSVAAQQKQALLMPGAIAMEATTPIAGLIRWCTLAPLYMQVNDLYSRLHLGVLTNILEIPITNPPKAVSAQHLAVPRQYIINYNLNRDEMFNTDYLELAIDRYAQSVQVALSTKCVYGKIDELLNQLDNLPYNKLMKIVIKIHKQTK